MERNMVPKVENGRGRDVVWIEGDEAPLGSEEGNETRKREQAKGDIKVTRNTWSSQAA
jgi:hypothetical protein